MIDDSADAEKEDYIDRQKEVGQIDNPIMRQFYATGNLRHFSLDIRIVKEVFFQSNCL